MIEFTYKAIIFRKYIREELNLIYTGTPLHMKYFCFPYVKIGKIVSLVFRMKL